MKNFVLLGFLLCLSANATFANVKVAEFPQVPLPYADPLAVKKVVPDIEVIKPDEKLLFELRPVAVVSNEEVKVKSLQITETNDVPVNNKESISDEKANIAPEPELVTEPVKEEINAESETNSVPVAAESHTDNLDEPVNNLVESVLQDNTKIEESKEKIKTEEAVTEENNTSANTEPTVESVGDSIELDVGKGDLFIPNTRRKEIPTEKINIPKPDIYNNMPKDLHTKDIKFDVDSAFTNSEFGPYQQYKKEKKSDDVEYRLNPNLSIKNVMSSQSENKQTTEPVMTLKKTEIEEIIDENNLGVAEAKFSAGEPSHNQIKYGKSIFSF